MKISLLETHDRYQEFVKDDQNIGACCQNIVDQRPFGNHPFYIFAHARTDDDGVTQRLIWQPRLTRPEAQSNSMLFKAYPGTDIIKVIWMIPKPELWGQYRKGNVTQNEIVSWSIEQFLCNKSFLNKKEDDDLSDEEIDRIYIEISQEANRQKHLNKLYNIKQDS